MMGNLREEFNRLAQTLAAEAENRRQFVARNRRESMQDREDNQREREQVARELARQARSLTQMLETSTSSLRRSVSRTLTENHDRRMRNAAEQSSSRKQTVASVRRHVAYSLERHRRDRVRMARQTMRTSVITMQSIRRRVADVKSQSSRLTAGVASDLAYGRQALAMARRSLSSAYRRSPLMGPKASLPSKDRLSSSN
jgi:hypothetical protein